MRIFLSGDFSFHYEHNPSILRQSELLTQPTPMKHLILTILSVISLSSCASGPNAQRGAVIGGLGGAAVGGIIGSQSGRGLEGAAIGAGLGAAGGAAIGNSQDRRRGYYY